MPPIAPELNNETKKKRSKFIWLGIIFLVVILALVTVLFVVKYGPNKIDPGFSDSIIPMNQETEEYFAGYINDLLKHLNISDGSGSELVESLKTSSSTVIFNGNLNAGLEVYTKDNIYYLKPKNFTGQESDYLLVAKKENINPDDILKNGKGEVEGGVYEILYKNLLSEKSDKEGVVAMRKYLDNQITAGLIERYVYKDLSDQLYLYYPNQEVPLQLTPIAFAEMADMVISGYANPENFAESQILEYEQEMSSGGVILINTLGEQDFIETINRKVLIKNLEIISSAYLSLEEKIEAVAGQIRYANINAESSHLNYSPNIAYAQAGESLIDKSGAIVPPNKAFFIFQGPDTPTGKLGNYVIDEFNKEDGAFSAFTKNGYFSMVVQRRVSEQPVIEKFADLMLDDKATSVIYDGHGFPGGFFMESYYIGPLDWDNGTVDPESLERFKSFRQRYVSLEEKYGKSSLSYSISPNLFYPRNIHLVGHDLGFYRNSLIRTEMYGSIGIEKPFFEKIKSQGYKKSIIIFDACFSGSLVDSVSGRVILTAPENSVTTDGMFMADLGKINQYLIKSQEPGGIKFEDAQMRNYDIATLFQSDLVINNAETPKSDKEDFVSNQRTCSSRPDILCTVVISGDETVSPSPHVQSADGTQVSFNVPMETSIKAEAVVTIDASQCQTSQKDLADLKPQWDSEGKAIKLPWLDKIYREWKPTDFGPNGFPQVDWAKITVKNDQAVSEFSKVNLTGNTDCFDETGKYAECWQEPETIKYNGNHPNTDFTFAMACIEENYYKVCENGAGPEVIKIIDKGESGGFLPPANITHGGNCYSRLDNPSEAEMNKAVEIDDDWKKSESCVQQCLVSTGGEDCMKNVLSIEIDPNSDHTTTNLLLNGKIILREEDRVSVGEYYFENGSIAAFGNHFAYVRMGPKPPLDDYYADEHQELIYDGSVYWTGKPKERIRSVELFGDNILFVYTTYYSGGELVVMYNGQKLDLYKDVQFDMHANMLLSERDGILSKDGIKIGSHYLNDYYFSGPVVSDNSITFVDYLTKHVYLDKQDMGEGSQPRLTYKHFSFIKPPTVIKGQCVYEGKNVSNTVSPSPVYYDGQIITGVDAHSLSIFGSRFGFLSSCNPVTREGATCYCQDSSDPNSDYKDTQFLFLDGKYYDIYDKMNINPVSDIRSFFGLEIFGNHFTFGMSSGNGDENNLHVVYDWKDLGPGENSSMFEDHIIFERAGEIVYDGRVIGRGPRGSSPVIYRDHVAYIGENFEHVYDGRVYKKFGDNRVSSIISSMNACRAYYFENEAR